MFLLSHLSIYRPRDCLFCSVLWQQSWSTHSLFQVFNHITCKLTLTSDLSLSVCLRAKLQDGQLLPEHRESVRWARSAHCLPSPSPLQRQWSQHFFSSPLRHQERVFLHHHSLSLPQQDHGQEGAGELSRLLCAPLTFLLFFPLSDCPHVFVSLLLHLSNLLISSQILSSNLFLCVCGSVLLTGWGPGSPVVFPAGSDQWPGGHEQILCKDDEHTHLWVHCQCLK